MTHTFSARTIAPVSLDEVKDYLRIDGTEEDAMLSRLIDVATSRVEERTLRSMITRTVTVDIDRREIAGHNLQLYYGPVQSITSVTAYDEDGDTTTVNSDDYYLDGDQLVGQNQGFQWDIERQYKALRIIYEAGDGDSRLDVQETMRQGVIECVAEMYEFRQGAIVGSSVADTGRGWKRTVAPYRKLALV